MQGSVSKLILSIDQCSFDHFIRHNRVAGDLGAFDYLYSQVFECHVLLCLIWTKSYYSFYLLLYETYQLFRGTS